VKLLCFAFSVIYLSHKNSNNLSSYSIFSRQSAHRFSRKCGYQLVWQFMVQFLFCFQQSGISYLNQVTSYQKTYMYVVKGVINHISIFAFKKEIPTSHGISRECLWKNK